MRSPPSSTCPALLRRHARGTGAIVLLSSHDLDLSLQLADWVWLVADGRVEAGSADQLVRSGSIARAFDTTEVAFSPKTSRFQLVAAAVAAP